MASATVVIQDLLAARPAALLEKVAKQFPCEITMRNVTTNSHRGNVKSILELIILSVEPGHTVEITTKGESAREALDTLVHLIESNFETE